MAVINGDFETGDFTGWAAETNQSFTVQSSQKYHLDYAAKAVLSSDGFPLSAYFDMYQDIDFTDMTNLKFWVYIDVITGGGATGTYFKVIIGEDTVYTRTTTTGGWIEVSINVSAYEGTQTLSFTGKCPYPDW